VTAVAHDFARAFNLSDELGAVQSRRTSVPGSRFPVPGSLLPGARLRRRRFPIPDSLESRALREVEHEVKSCPLLELRLHSELAAHGSDELLADR
jgi:hypothetical protein